MSEITKLYENARIKPDIDYICDIEPDGSRSCDRVESYPEFTAEKQIELIKFLLKNYDDIDISKGFEESLAGVINELWADMSEEEKQQIKEILECLSS